MRRERRETIVDISRGVVSLGEAQSLVEVVDRLPTGIDWRFEPDWDGLGVIVRLGHEVDELRPGSDRLVSDRGRTFDRYFPELIDQIRSMPGDEAVVRGSLVVVSSAGMDHQTVRLRLHPAKARVASLAITTPATLVLTDLLTRGSVDARAAPIDERRGQLERLASEMGIEIAPSRLRRMPPGPSILLTPQTFDGRVARAWLHDRDSTGRDGVIARHADGRRCVRVRRSRNAACVVTGFRRTASGELGAVRLGMFDGDVLVDVGRTAAIRQAPVRREMVGALRTVAPVAVTLSAVRSAWVDVPPALVCEVRFDRLNASRFRRAVTFVRWLPDRDPRTCALEQLMR